MTGLQIALDGKAPLASPALTGTPTAPTPASGTNTTQLATTAFVLGTRLDQLAQPLSAYFFVAFTLVNLPADDLPAEDVLDEGGLLGILTRDRCASCSPMRSA